VPYKPVALVTGANQGIGLQIAKDLVPHGFTVVVGSRNFEKGQAAAKSIGADARAVQLDVTNHESIAAAAQRIRKEFGRLDVLIQNAGARIVNVSSGVGSLTASSDPAYPYRAIFGPVYPASKTALNALTVAMALELEPDGIKVNAVSPGYTKTNLNGYSGTETLEEGAREAVRVALLGSDGPTGKFTRWNNETIPW
jgi:NAD(P)-dependent dehydrogenase (short-subunit alcohol dehydrogenase family)